MQSSSALEPASSSAMSSDAACNQHCNRLKTQPDLLNFKKGWMMQKDTEGQWQKRWFVLTDQSLRFYRDSGAEKAGDIGGDINVSTCYDITEYPAEKNYGFQIHTKEGVYTLCGMTAGIRHSWVQAILKNVRPTLTPDVPSSLPEPRTPLKSQRSDSQPAGAVGSTDSGQSNTEVWCKTLDWTEAGRQQKKQQEPGRGRSGTGGSSEMSPDSLSPVASLVSSLPSSSSSQSLGDLLKEEEEVEVEEEEEGEGQNSGRSLSRQRPLVIGPPQAAGVTDASLGLARSQYEEGIGGDSSTSTLEPQDISLKAETEHKEAREEHTGKENGLVSTSSAAAQAMALKRLQKINQDLRFELEAQRRSQEEARDAELRRRVDLLAQQAQLLVTGDATALAQAHLEKDRRCFQEQREEWQRAMASLRSQLHLSEEQRRDTEDCLLQQQQQAAQDYQTLRKEADGMREYLQEAATQLRANEEAQAEKEDRLQKHLVLLQESQERERRSMAASLAQAERHAQDLQDRLERAEQQVESLNKDQSWARQVDEAQQQLQEELACTVSSMQRLQEDREQISHRCQELQNQLAEADGEMSRLQNRLKTEETEYYNMEHSHERACEELQLALGQVKSSQADAQDIREGYERLLDMREQELSEVLVKMEILGNSLEETEEKLSDVLKVCTCACSRPERLSSSEPVQHDKGQLHSPGPPLEANDTLLTVTHNKQLSSSSNNADVAQLDGNDSHTQCTRTRSHSLDPSYQHIMSARDDPEKFMSVIQILETKLNVTEEKLRDVTQHLEEHQSHVGCQDPHLCSQLTQSRATTQHLSLLLHNQARQSKRFAQETEYCFKVLLDRFQFALESVETCKGRLQPLLKNSGQSGMYTDAAVEFDKQLASVAACLRQGEKEAEHQQHECQYTCTTMSDKLPETEVEIDASEDVMGIGRTLLREAGLVEKMVSVLQSPCGIGHLQLVSRNAEGDLLQQYKSIISQSIALEIKKRIQQGETDDGKSVESTIGRVCAEAELIYAALTLQRLHECTSQGDLQVKDQVMTHLWQGPLKGGDLFYVPRGLVRPPERSLCEGQEQQDGRDFEQDGKQVYEGQSVKDHDWLNRLVSKLQRRAEVLHQLHQDISDCAGPDTKNSEDYSWESAVNLKWVEDQAKLIYLSDRLYLDFEQELQRMKAVCDRLKDLCQNNNIVRTDEQQAFSNTISQLLQENNILREKLGCAEQNIMAAATGNQRLLEDMQKIEDRREDRMQTLEMEFQEKIRELQQIHEDEMKHLHSYYAKSAGNYRDTQNKPGLEAAPPIENTTSPSDLTLHSAVAPDELRVVGRDDQVGETREGQMNRFDVKVKPTEEEPGYRTMERDPVAMREAYQRDFEKLKASCEQGFSAMEETHRKLVCDLKQQHQREVAALLQEKDHLLKEETAATVTAIVAMRKAHKEELERRSCWPQHVVGNADISQLHTEYQNEIQLLRKELETLSVQHTQKCLENSHMRQQLEAERQAFSQCQQEKQWMKDKQEMTDKVLQEISHMHCSPKEQPEEATQAKLYEMEVILRLKEAELQCLIQEALSLRQDLKAALMDKSYAMDRLEALHDISNLSEDLKYATCSPHGTDNDAAQQKMTWQQPEVMLNLQRKYLSPIEGYRLSCIPDLIKLVSRPENVLFCLPKSWRDMETVTEQTLYKAMSQNIESLKEGLSFQRVTFELF